MTEIFPTAGSFGWDDTASIVPTSMVPSYAGTSAYLLMTKYNNYGGAVKRLNAINEQLGMLDMATAPNFMLNGLKRAGVEPSPYTSGTYGPSSATAMALRSGALWAEDSV